MLRSNRNTKLSIALVWAGLAASAVGHAALFDDNEARKRILQLESKQLADHDAQQATLTELGKTQRTLEKRIQTLESMVSNQVFLDLQNQLDQIKQEMAQLKGDLELVSHQLESLQGAQKEQYTDLDTRLRRLETGGGVSVAPAAGAVTTTESKPLELSKSIDTAQQEQRLFAEAEAYQQAGKFKEAFAAYDNFLKSYAGSKLTPEALYGMGFAQFGLKNYKSSIATQQKLLDAYPAHALAPQAMMSQANSQIQLGQIPAAKKTLKDLIQAYPNAEVVPNAQKRLKVLETLK